ncbi:hypothetical protein JCM14469_40370 [Desulfatiferula olefinivorans]
MTVHVSVCMITYQHAPFIKKALDSVCEQKVNFPLEIVLGDDGSTDGTVDILRAYEKHAPQLRVRYCPENAGDGGRANAIDTMRACRGEYIALLEGDDYWTDHLKLQKQYDYMNSHPEAAGCFHNARLLDDKGQVIKEKMLDNPPARMSQADVFELFGREPTCSIFFRARILNPMPEWFLAYPCDFFFGLLITANGSYDGLNELMADHVRHAGGWSALSERQRCEHMLYRYRLLKQDSGLYRTHKARIDHVLTVLEERRQRLDQEAQA